MLSDEGDLMMIRIVERRAEFISNRQKQVMHLGQYDPSIRE